MSGSEVSASLVGATEGVTVSLATLQAEAGKVWLFSWCRPRRLAMASPGLLCPQQSRDGRRRGHRAKRPVDGVAGAPFACFACIPSFSLSQQ
jgi:hypothetical protein